MKTHRWSILALLGLGACAGAPSEGPTQLPQSSPPATANAAQKPAPAVPGLRLPRAAAPTRYAATLSVVPGDKFLRGEIAIDMTLSEPASFVWLNANRITVDSAEVEQSGRKIGAKAVPGDDDHIGFAFDEELPKGSARLLIAYQAEISSEDDHGVFSEKEGDSEYVYTQFESMSARRAFPCFDEPSFKVPWQLNLRVKKEHTAISNTSVTKESDEEGGTKLYRFAETKPLPSYLVAFAVGSFDVIDAGKAGRNNTPVRVVVPRGYGDRAAYAAKVTPKLLGFLEDYFEIPYPYDKLDIVPVPRLISFGAMENPGLVTYRMSGSLASKEQETIFFKRGFNGTMAHELAHQWFGDLVTTAFWDDIWLNEAFASWMGSKIEERNDPEWHHDVARVESASYAMGEDGLSNARRIRQPIEAKDDVFNAFDAITYSKGEAVLGMFEAWIGPERFQKGVRRYLSEHAHKNATSREFLAALAAESGEVGGQVGAAFSSFLDQPGVPLVRAELACEKGKSPVIRLSQERYRPLGSSASSDEKWQIPVCARYGVGKKDGRACTLLAEKKADLTLADAPSCPDWIALKERGVGYYRASYEAKMLKTLLASSGSRLNTAERVAVLSDAEALLSNGALSFGDALALLPELSKDPNPMVVKRAAILAFKVRDQMLNGTTQPAFTRFVQKTFGKKALELGILPKDGEPDSLRELRPYILGLVGLRGGDKKIAAEAKSLADRFLDDPKAVPEETIDLVLGIATRGGDRKLFDRLYAAAKAEKDQRRRNHLLAAMASFRDPAIVKDSLSIVLRDEFDPRDEVRLLIQDPRTADVSLSFFRENIDALFTHVPKPALGYLPHAFESLCDEKGRAEVEALFKSRLGKMPGGPRTLSQVLEKITLCSVLKEKQEASLAAFLKKY